MKASASITITSYTDGLTTFYQYAKNTSNTSPPTTGWSPTVPASEVGKFIWRREGQALAGDTPSTWSAPVCLTGVDGIGILEVVEYYALSDVSTEVNILSNTDFSDGETGWTSQKETWDITGGIATLHNGGSIYQGLTSEYLPKQTVTVVVKAKGTGKLIVRWGGTSSSGVDVTQDWDIYHTTLAVEGNNNLIIESSVDGVLEIDWIKAVENITATNYWVPNVPATITEWQEEPMTPTAELPFLWNYEKIFYTDGSFEETLKRIIGVHGDKGLAGSQGDPGVGILAVTAEYISHTSSTSLNDLDEESEWTPEPPERGFGEYTWMRTIIYYDNDTSSMTEPVCITGDRGPVGKTGEVGVYVESNTLYVKGFNEDGELTEESGFLFTSNARYLVQSTEYLLTGGGVGYIGLSGGEVLVLKLNPQVGYIEWLDYNTGIEKFPDIIFGKIDKKVSGVIDISLITPSSTSEFITSHFMTIMANAVDGTDISTEAGRDKVKKWADALGISQFFESIAVLEAFIHILTVNKLNIESDNLKVKVSPDGFVDGGVAYPLFSITDGAGKPILQIDGKNKNLFIETSNGIIRALLQVYNTDGSKVLETVREEGLSTVDKSHTKTLYSVAELKAKATESTEPASASAGSAFKGTAFTRQCFRSSAGKLTFGYSPLSVNSGTTAGAKTASLTLPTKLGAQKVVVSGTRSFSGTTLKRNGTVISGALPQTFDYIAGDIYEVSATRSGSTYTEYRYTATKYEWTGGSWNYISHSTTSWGGKKTVSGAFPSSPKVGQVFTRYSAEETRTQTDYSANAISLTLTYESSASYPAGFVFITSGGSYLTLPHTSGYLVESSFSIVLNGWSSASNKKYISGSDIIADYNAIAINIYHSTKTANSEVTSYKEPSKGNSPLSGIDTVVRTASSITFSKGTQSRTIVAFEGNGKSGGVYEEFKAKVETIGTTAAVLTADLKPVNASTNIGESGNRYNTGYFNIVYGQINSEGTRNDSDKKVWGAVFN